MKKRIWIWIVDSNPSSVEFIEKGLRRGSIPYSLVRIFSISEVQKMLESHQPDIILTDWQLSDGSGLDLISIAAGKNIPTIVMHDNGNIQFAAKAIKAGAIDYVAKTPETVAEISVIIYKALKQWKNKVVRQVSEQKLSLLTQKLREQDEKYTLLKAQMNIANTALQASEQKLRAIFGAATNISFIIGEVNTDDPKIIDCSQGTEIIFGYSRDELTGQKVSILHPPDYAADLHDISDKLLNNKIGFNGETILVRKSGERFPALLTTFPVNDETGGVIYGLGVAIDITGLKKMENTLRENEQQLRTLINAMPDIVCFKDAGGRWIEANESELKLFQLEGVKYKGRKDSELAAFSPFYHESLLHCEESDIMTWKRACITRYEETFPMPDGSVKIFDILKVPTYDPKGNRHGLIVVGRNITERKIMEDQIVQTKNELDAILQGIADGIVVIDLKNIIYCNQAALTMTGYASSEEFKAEVSNFQTDRNIEIFDEDGAPFIQWHEIFEQVWKGQTTQPITVQYKHRNNEKRHWTTFRASPVFDANRAVKYVVCIFHDITVSRHADDNLRKLSMAVDQSPVMVVITDIHGNIEYTNPKFTRVTGYEPHELMGQNPRILKSDNKSDAEYKELWKTITAGNEWHGEFYNRKKDGSLYWESAMIAPIKNAKGAISHFIAVKEDISSKKQLEADLIKAKEKAEESDRLKTAFLANLSHEIRTPMNAIMGFSDLIVESGFSEEKKNNFARLIHHRAADLLDVINDILDISRIETNQLSIQESAGNISELFTALFEMFNPKINDNIKFSFQNNLPNDETSIFADFNRLKQVFTNLLNNAIKYTRSGSIEFGCYLKNSFTLLFYVKDTGKGIPAEKVSVIFQSFRQADDNYTTRQGGGTGLGLSIVRGIIELMHGKVWAESKESEGSVFYFTIPYKPARQVKLRDILVPARGPYDWRNNCILVVEDDPSSLTFLLELLGLAQVQVLKATSGAEALKLFTENNFIDLVLMDIQLPDISGIALTEEMLKIKPGMPIIMQTAFATDVDKETCLRAGCCEYLIKPFSQNELFETIHKYLPAR